MSPSLRTGATGGTPRHLPLPGKASGFSPEAAGSRCPVVFDLRAGPRSGWGPQGAGGQAARRHPRLGRFQGNRGASTGSAATSGASQSRQGLILHLDKEGSRLGGARGHLSLR